VGNEGFLFLEIKQPVREADHSKARSISISFKYMLPMYRIIYGCTVKAIKAVIT
jgi:hypothetical protein